MDKEKLSQIINSIYEWPISEVKSWQVYKNLKELAEEEDNTDILDFLRFIVAFDKNQRLDYRNYLASLGYELRPDEFNQYILIIMIVLTEMVEV
jgi:hypothetical protein